MRYMIRKSVFGGKSVLLTDGMEQVFETKDKVQVEGFVKNLNQKYPTVKHEIVPVGR